MMNNKLKYSIIATVLIGILVYMESIAPRETDWTPTYSEYDKIPYGTWVIRHSLNDLFPGASVQTVNESFYQHRGKTGIDNSDVMIITNRFEPDSLDLDLLFSKAANGNDIFIASRFWSKSFTDSLHLQIERKLNNLFDSVTTLQVRTLNGWSNKVQFNKLIPSEWFSFPDSVNIATLGKGNDAPNFVKVPYGNGSFLLHSQPLAFTNYHLLYNDNSYQEKVLGWIRNKSKKLDWDEYYKPFRVNSSSPIQVILAIKALRAAYWTLLIGLILYVFTNIRRRQRAIPVLAAKTNLSLDFVQTIGLLFHNRKDHKDLVKKIFAVFAEHVTSKYFIHIDFSAETCKKLANKSGVSEKTVTQLFDRYKVLSNKEQVHEDELFRFNSLIETFYRESRQATIKNKHEQQS